MMLRILALSIVVLITGCSYLAGEKGVFRDRKYDYRHAQEAERLQVPSKLDSERIVDYYPVPPISPHADPELIIKPPLPTGMLLDVDERVRIQRLGEKEWILVQVSPSQLWPRLKAYTQSHGLQLLLEEGARGVLVVTSSEGFYRFHLQQGFQHNSAELAVRFSNDASIIQSWPEHAQYAEKESTLLSKMAHYFADAEQPAYSFAAHNISTEQRLLTHFDAHGNRYLVLKADFLRVKASLERALEKGGYTKQDSDDYASIVAQFTPQSAKTLKPGFWRRLFKIKPKPYDKSIEYAGNVYRFSVHTDEQGQKVRIERIDVAQQNEKQLQKELNQQLMRIKGLLI